jgi:hypothetical protein
VSAVVRLCCGSCTEGSRQLILCLVRRMRPRRLLILLVLATFAGCTEVVRQYRADSSGRLRHVKTFTPEWGRVPKHVSYTINGVTFRYDLSPIRGDVRGHRHAPSQLPAGKDFIPFHVGSDASLLEAAFDAPGVTWFSGSVRALSGKQRNQQTTLGGVTSPRISLDKRPSVAGHYHV